MATNLSLAGLYDVRLEVGRIGGVEMGFTEIATVAMDGPTNSQQPILPSRFDPRPDLVDDHMQWIAVLSIAWYRNRQLWGLLHGFRCGGSTLVTKTSPSGEIAFHLDYSPLLETWDKDELKNRWLMPYVHSIKELFVEAPRFLTTIPSQEGMSR